MQTAAKCDCTNLSILSSSSEKTLPKADQVKIYIMTCPEKIVVPHARPEKQDQDNDSNPQNRCLPLCKYDPQ